MSSYYLQKGSREIGPMEAENIVALLQAGDCLPTDLIRREEDSSGWMPAGTVFPEGSWSRHEVDPLLIGSSNPLAVTLRQLLNEEQDEGVCREMVSTLSTELQRGERVQAVTVQKYLLPSLTTEAIVATTDRLLFVRDLVLGKKIEAIVYAEIALIAAESEMLGAVLRMETRDRRVWTIKSLPKESAEKVVRYARARMEQISVTPMETAASDLGQVDSDPLARLKRLKELLDLGAISEAEYAAKKGEILPLL